MMTSSVFSVFMESSKSGLLTICGTGTDVGVAITPAVSEAENGEFADVTAALDACAVSAAVDASDVSASVDAGDGSNRRKAVGVLCCDDELIPTLRLPVDINTAGACDRAGI